MRLEHGILPLVFSCIKKGYLYEIVVRVHGAGNSY